MACGAGGGIWRWHRGTERAGHVANVQMHDSTKMLGHVANAHRRSTVAHKATGAASLESQRVLESERVLVVLLY